MGIEDDKAKHDAVNQQFGDSVALNFVNAAGVAQDVATNLIKWNGLAKWDTRAWRVYLGPWVPKAGIAVTAPLLTTYAIPTPWGNNGPPDRFDRFVPSLSLYARIHFGSAGGVHAAYVDWPPRGCLVQVSGSYVQVDALAVSGTVTAADAPNLPIIAASLTPEPGGGDSAAPATFTYPAYPLPDATTVVTFQIPPFARTFQIIPGTVADATALDIKLTSPGAVAAFAEYTVALPLSPSTNYPIPQSAKDVVIKASGGTPPYTTTTFGLLFHLDL